MKKPVFTGVCTALVTPFRNGQIDFLMVEKLLQRQLDAGVRTIVLSGTTGEAPTLSDEEKIKLIDCAKECVGDRCTIIAGTGSNDTVHALQMSRSAQAAGADALLVVSPYYNKGNADGLYSHYLSIANSVSIPIILYNVPGRTGVDMPVPLYKRLSAVPNIAGVKEASTDITKYAQIRAACGEDFHIWAGNDNMIVPVMALGGKGAICVVSNVCPKETKAIVDASLDGDFDTAADLQCRLMELMDLLFCDVNPIPVKYAMGLIGYECASCRLPLGQLSVQNKQKLNNYFL